MPSKVPPLQLPVVLEEPPALKGWRGALLGWATIVARLANNPVLEGLSAFTVAKLPTSAATASVAYASNGRKAGEGVGAGTGVLVYKSANGSWYRASDDTVVVA